MDVWAMLGESRPALVQLFDPLPRMRLEPGRAALLVVDMEYGSVVEGEGLIALAEAQGISMTYYGSRLRQVISNIRRLQEGFRGTGLEVVYTKGRGTKGGHSLGGVRVRPLRSDREPRRRGIIADLVPQDGEVVIEKDTPGPFGVTNIDHALRMLGVDILVVTGVVTDQCVEATVRGAFDFGYQVILAEDACATVSAELHAASLRVLADWFCRVWTTAEVLEDLRRLREEV
jgi:ureidoacrylate peracid hydrolase